ncbi:MAG: IS200/IS605 family transposase [Planctomycetota bacterium]|jgi:REP element-mobilizing transposase RayT
MPHSYVCCNIHYVFSTKNRAKTITAGLKDRLCAYIGGIARENKMKALIVGGADDHVHLLIALPSTLSVAKAIQLIKGGSSKWMNETFPNEPKFEWQEGYAAFSVSASRIPETVQYVKIQEEHHRRKSFQEEFLAFLEKHGVEYDPRYVWGCCVSRPQGTGVSLMFHGLAAINRWAIFVRPFGVRWRTALRPRAGGRGPLHLRP